MKRLGLFMCFDSEGIMDPYVEYLLKKIKPCLDELCIVCNGPLQAASRTMLLSFADRFVMRPNIGFDAGAWRDAMVSEYGFDKLASYDEIVLFNDSFFGPIYPFEDMFLTMDARTDLDFWGMTSHEEAPNVFGMCPYGYRPEYLQTYFICIRRRMVQSEAFQSYWSALPDYIGFEELAEKHGCVFTKYFADLGYHWAAYIDTTDLQTCRDKAMSFHTYAMYDMVVNRKMPVIKRKSFSLPREIHLMYNTGSELTHTLNYIREHTDYDISLIYHYLSRYLSATSLTQVLGNVHILSSAESIQDPLPGGRAVVICHQYYQDLWSYTKEHLLHVPATVDIIVTTDAQEKAAFFRSQLADIPNHTRVYTVNPRGRDIAALLVGCRDLISQYDYVCYLHDKKSLTKEYITVGNAFRDMLWDNLIPSAAYIVRVLHLFEANPELGLLCPPAVSHGSYFSTYSNAYWTMCVDEANELLRTMGIAGSIDRHEETLSLGTCFWFRPSALAPLFALNLDYTDFHAEPMPPDGTISHAIERIFPMVASHAGYQTGVVMTEAYGTNELINYRYMMRETINTLKNKEVSEIAYDSFLVFRRTLGTYLDHINTLQEQSRAEIETLKNEVLLRDHTIKVMNDRERSVKWSCKRFIKNVIRKILPQRIANAIRDRRNRHAKNT